MKKSNIPCSEKSLKRPKGMMPGLMGGFLIAVIICVIAVPAVSAGETLGASITVSSTSLEVGETFTFTGSATGTNITGWAWTFGDGDSASIQSTTHSYESAGTFSVSLTITDAAGETDTDTQSVIVTEAAVPLEASFSGTPLSGEAPLTVSFTDESEGEPTGWEWNFGDGSALSTDPKPSHEYTSQGDYTVTLTVKNDDGPDTKIQEDYITVIAPVTEKPPVASFNTNGATGDAPLTVKFTDISPAFNGASIAIRKWDFGDGSGIIIITEPNTEHTFESVKSYTVRLTVTDSAGLSSSTTETITAENPLMADFKFSRENPKADEKVTFIDQSDGYPDKWVWDFDDTTGSESEDPTHTFTKDGEYDVKLIIRKDGFPSDSVTKTITVGEGTTTVTGDKPDADFKWSSGPVVGQAVSFTDTSTGTGINQWKWDFDDSMDFTGNRESTLKSPKHTYQNTGSYYVTLTVWNSGGNDIIGKTVNVGTVRLNANFNTYPSSGTAPLSVRFVDSSTGADIDSWYWDFGNGQTYTGKSPSNIVYSSPGTYTVSLEVKDGSKTDEYTKRISVSPQATAATAKPTSVSTVTPTPAATDAGFIDGEYRKMVGLYNEYIRIIFGFFGIDDEPDFLIIAVDNSRV